MSACIPTSRRTACSISPIRADGAGGNATTVARAELGDGGLRGVTVIFEALPRAPGGLHFGSRIVFDRAGLMYVSIGERYQHAARPGSRRSRRQGRAAAATTASVPPDNPFVGRAGARPEIFTWGHRNPQGLAMPSRDRQDLGGRARPARRRRAQPPEGRRQLRLAAAPPTASTTTARSSARNKSLPGMEDPLRIWVPSISPCGLCFYTGDSVPRLEGLAVHRRAVRLRAVPHRARRRALSQRGAVDRRPSSLYPRRSPGARRAALPRHP